MPSKKPNNKGDNLKQQQQQREEEDVAAGEEGEGGGEGTSSATATAAGNNTKKKKNKSSSKKKKASSVPNSQPTSANKKEAAAEEDNNDSFGEKNKRRNSLTDSPLTELSPSSTTSNGDSADDIDAVNSSSKQGSSEEDGSSQSLTNAGSYVVNPPLQQQQNEVSKTINFPFLDCITEEENINEIEREYAYEILMGQKKHLIKQLKYNKWTDHLCQTILTGDFPSFYRHFKMVMICLRKRSPHYRQLTDMQLATHVALNVVERFYNEEDQTTILMILLANSDRNTKCSDKDHGFCRIAHMLLKLLGRKELAKLLDVTTKKSGKNALQLATATGEPCQLQVLLALTEIDANHLDMSYRAALHYAIERNNLAMVRMLMWYGADISLCYSWNSYYDPLHLSLCADPNSSVQHWLSDRVNAISRKVHGFARQLCSRVYCVKKELSPVHFVRFGSCWAAHQPQNIQIRCECQFNLRANNSSSSLAQLLKQNPKSKIILFMIPVSFRTSDQFSAAADPKIVRVEFPDNSIITNPMITYNNKPPANILSFAFHQLHNHYFYAYEIMSPSAIEGLHKLIFNIKSKTGFTDDSRTVLLAIQAYLCTEEERGTKSKLE